ncbi:uncharacterized protein [Miscanthus floridulus]|uniref:uncharacterized protein n=1 Tax=Miscanthus floridulus TaxID=154761 RepID=UPI00345A8B5B
MAVVGGIVEEKGDGERGLRAGGGEEKDDAPSMPVEEKSGLGAGLHLMEEKRSQQEEVNGLGLTQIQPSDVVRRILGVLPIDKYEHIVTVLHQGDLSTSTPTQILGKINAHEMYMHITPQDGSSSGKKKDLAFKGSQEKKGKAIVNEVILASSSDDDDSNIALMVKKTTKMMKRLNKNGVKFDSKKKMFFTSSKRKPISEMDCYNCGDLGHLAHQCPKPKKDKYKKKYKDNKDDSSDEDDKYKKKNKPYKKRDGKKKEYHKKKNGKAYIVGDWLTDLDTSSGSSGEDSDDEKEKVAAIVIGSSPSTPPSSPSSSTHLCLMGKGDRKVQSEDESSGNESGDDSDSEDKFEAPTYDELVKLLNKYSKIIMKTRDKNEKLNLENDTLLTKYDIAKKVSVELRDENKVVLSTLKELKTSLKELKEKHDKLEGIHKELKTRHNLLKDEYTNLKINHENLVLSHELLSIEPHDATNNIVKIDIATSCDDLIDESIEQGSSSKGKQVVVANQYDDYVKLKNENEKLNEEIKQLKKEKEHLSTGLHKFTRGHNLQSELLMNTMMKMDKSGIGYLANQEKKMKAKQQHQNKPKPKLKRCFECGQEEMEDTIAEVTQIPPPIQAELTYTMTEFPHYNTRQLIQGRQQRDEAIRAIAEAELAQTEAQPEDDTSSDDDFLSDSLDEDYRPIPHMPPREHDHKAGGSSLAPPQPPQTDPTLLAILERMRED